MYLQFYGFKEVPFNLTPDSKFLFLSHRHQEALAALLFGVQERKGFILLTGDIGCGKTTLCRAMLSQLDPEQVKVCVVLNSYLSDIELLKTINEGFGLPADSDSKKQLLDGLNEYLVQEFAAGHNVVLIIDEAQNLRPETLEQIRMISNLETETAKLIQIMLVGQPELRRTLGLPELEQLNQRITVRYHITPLEESEIPEYVKHRLIVAEPQVEISFSQQAYRLIYHYSKGVPRRINVICDRALLVGYIQGSFTLDDKLVQRAVNEVRGESGQFASSASASSAGMGGAPGEGSRLMQRIGMGAIYALLIVGCAFFGVWLFNHFNSEKRTDGTVATNNPSKTPTAFPSPTPRVLEHVGAPALPSLTPKATPTPAPTPLIFDNWQTDPEGILRVRSDALSEAAAYINLVRRWDIIIDLPLFQQTPADQVAQFDMLTMMKQLNFSAYMADQLPEALRLDMPVLVNLGSSQTFSPWVVVNSVAGEVYEVIDPVHGRMSVNRSKLLPSVKRTIVLYKDPDGYATLAPGEKSDRVLKMQRVLATQTDAKGDSLFSGTPDGKFGTQTREALQKLQTKLGLEQTGTLSGPTGPYVASLLTPRRPRLFT